MWWCWNNLNAQDAHTIFLAAYNFIIETKRDSGAILASLKSNELKGIYTYMLKHKKEVKAIMEGNLNKTQIKELQD